MTMTCLIGVLVLRSLVPSGVAAITEGAMIWLAIEKSDEHRNSFDRSVLSCIDYSPLLAARSGRRQACSKCEASGLHLDCSSMTHAVVLSSTPVSWFAFGTMFAAVQ